MTIDERLAECEREIREAADDMTTHDVAWKHHQRLQDAALARLTGWQLERARLLALPSYARRKEE